MSNMLALDGDNHPRTADRDRDNQRRGVQLMAKPDSIEGCLQRLANSFENIEASLDNIAAHLSKPPITEELLGDIVTEIRGVAEEVKNSGQ